MWLMYAHLCGACNKQLLAESPLTLIADNFLAFPAGNCFCDFQRLISLLLSTRSSNWRKKWMQMYVCTNIYCGDGSKDRLTDIGVIPTMDSLVL